MDREERTARQPPLEVIRRYQHGYVLHARAERYTGFSESGGLSIKTMAGGQAVYTLGRARLLVDDQAYAVLNAGQPYEVEVDAGTESFCIFFRQEALDGLWQAVSGPLDHLLERFPAKPHGGFFQRRYAHDSPLSAHLKCWRSLNLGQPLTFNEGSDALLAALEQLLVQHVQVGREADQLRAARPSTRAELFRRLHRARDHLEATLYESLGLDDAAQIANLSPYHFHRAFRNLFGETPAAHVRNLRLKRACTLLRTTTLPIHEICSLVGQESLGSFGVLFRRHHGVSPGEYRRLHGHSRRQATSEQD